MRAARTLTQRETTSPSASPTTVLAMMSTQSHQS